MLLRNTPIVPSLLSADFFNLSKAFSLFEQYSINRIHIDVMDGHFVPPISIGYPPIQSIRSRGSYFFDTHLMVSNPEHHIEQCAQAGCNAVTFHIETVDHVHRLIETIRRQSMQVGVAVLPKTPIDALTYILDAVDIVLVMLVDPGFSGQQIIPAMLTKLEELNTYKQQKKMNFGISVDGGVHPENIHTLIDKGANYLISGSSFFDDSVRTHLERYIEQEN